MPVIRDVLLSIELASALNFELTFVQTSYPGRYRIIDSGSWQNEEVMDYVKTPST